MSIKVSVIVPVYNSEEYLQKCLKYLINQTIDEIEIICIDDCSTDGSVEILGSAIAQYPNKVKAISLAEHLGPGGARNVGIEMATGEYIGFVDSDDIVDLTMFEKMYKKAKENDYDIVDCGYLAEHDGTCVIMVSDEMQGKINSRIRSSLLENLGFIVSKIYKRELVSDLRFRKRIIYEDLDYLMQVYIRAKSIGAVNEILYTYTYREDSSSNVMDFDLIYYSTRNVMLAMTKILQKYTLKKAEKDAIIYHILWQYAKVIENYMLVEEGQYTVSINKGVKELSSIVGKNINALKGNMFADKIKGSKRLVLEMARKDTNSIIELRKKIKSGEEENFVYIERKLELQMQEMKRVNRKRS